MKLGKKIDCKKQASDVVASCGLLISQGISA